MPAATTKTDLRDVTLREFAKLEKLLGAIDDEAALAPGPEGGPSIKDTVAHRMHWIGLFMGWYTDGQAGKEVAIPAPGYKWTQLPAYNAALRERQVGLGWNEAQHKLRQAHAGLVAWIDGQTEASLYAGPMKGGHSKWTAGRWAEAAGASHYRSAAKYIRLVLRSQSERRA